MEIANLAVRNVERLGLDHGASPMGKVTISAGVTTYSSVGPDSTVEDMIVRANLALYDAKNGEKNCMCFIPQDQPEPPSR